MLHASVVEPAGGDPRIERGELVAARLGLDPLERGEVGLASRIEQGSTAAAKAAPVVATQVGFARVALGLGRCRVEEGVAHRGRWIVRGIGVGVGLGRAVGREVAGTSERRGLVGHGVTGEALGDRL